MSFREYLEEAKFAPGLMPKVMEKVSKIVGRRIGEPLYAFNGNGMIELTGGGKTVIAYLYFMRSKKAIRFNTVKGEFHSIELWRKYKHGAPSDYTIRLNGLNIVQLLDLIIPHILKPREGDFPVAFLPESVEHSGDVLTEARNIKDPQEFYDMAKAMFGGIKNVTALTWVDINNIGVQNDVRIPGWVRASKKGSGTGATYSAMPPAMANAATDKPEDMYYIKVTRRDPETNKFASIKDDKHAIELTKQINRLVQSPIPSPEELKDPNTLFGHMKSLIDLVCKGVNPSLFIYGGPGIGKTFVVTNTIKENGLVKDQDWYLIKGKVTPSALYRQLFIHRLDGKLLVFDDSDSAFGDNDSANILKAALDSYDERVVSWYSNRTVNTSKMSPEEREEYEKGVDEQLEADPASGVKLPSQFLFTGRIIFISNLDKSQVDSAILSRSYKIDMSLTPEQIFARMESLLEKIEPEVDLKLKQHVLEVLRSRNAMGDLAYPNMRTFVSACKIASSGIPNWVELLQFT